MNVVISAHMDLARPAMFIKMDEKNLLGLVDNFAGVFASYSVSGKQVLRYILLIMKSWITMVLMQ